MTIGAADTRGILAYQKLFFTDQGRGRVGEGFFGGQREKQLPLQERNGTLQDDVRPCTLPLPTPTASLWSLTLVWPHSHCIGDGLEFLIHLSYWDYMHVSPHPFYLVLGAWFRAS